jgi:hypothetical protein
VVEARSDHQQRRGPVAVEEWSYRAMIEREPWGEGARHR